MCLFIETICLENEQAINLSYHNARLNETRKHFFGTVPEIYIDHSINTLGKQKRTRCRITYAEQIIKIEYFDYNIRQIKKLKLTEADNLEYAYKYADRSVFDNLLKDRGESDDLIIVQNGMLTDTTFSNIALWDGNKWYTPAKPLLKGTKRQYLLDKGIITTKDIRADDITRYRNICLFNSMLHFGEIIIPCEHIIQ